MLSDLLSTAVAVSVLAFSVWMFYSYTVEVRAHKERMDKLKAQIGNTSNSSDETTLGLRAGLVKDINNLDYLLLQRSRQSISGTEIMTRFLTRNFVDYDCQRFEDGIMTKRTGTVQVELRIDERSKSSSSIATYNAYAASALVYSN